MTMFDIFKERCKEMIPFLLEGNHDLDMMTQRMQNLFKFQNFNDLMNSSPEQTLAIIKATLSSLINQEAQASLRTGREEAIGSRILPKCCMITTEATFLATITVLYMSHGA